jgi:PIN domain
MFIVFDSNIWISHLALNSPSGAAVRFFIKQRGATIAMPEVVRLEIERNLTRRIQEWIAKITENHRQLLAVFGNLKDSVLPFPEQIKERVDQVLSAVDVPITHIPFSLEAARSSFLKTIDKVAPSKNSQQFKDGVIWANCLELLTDADVYLVTDDSAFYENRDVRKGLAHSLIAELDGRAHQLKLIPDLDVLLEEMRVELKFDKTRLASIYLQKHEQSIGRLTARHMLTLREPPEVKVKLYATESTARIYFTFSIKYHCDDTTDRGINDAQLVASGDGQYDTDSGDFSQLRSETEELTYTDAEGDQKRQRNISLMGNIATGHRSIQHTVRVPLD